MDMHAVQEFQQSTRREGLSRGDPEDNPRGQDNVRPLETGAGDDSPTSQPPSRAGHTHPGGESHGHRGRGEEGGRPGRRLFDALWIETGALGGGPGRRAVLGAGRLPPHKGGLPQIDWNQTTTFIFSLNYSDADSSEEKSMGVE